MAEEKPKGYLVITVIEAAGKNKDELYVWDTAEFEGYVKSTCHVLELLSVQI
jgi:hypothetical protein